MDVTSSAHYDAPDIELNDAVNDDTEFLGMNLMHMVTDVHVTNHCSSMGCRQPATAVPGLPESWLPERIQQQQAVPQSQGMRPRMGIQVPVNPEREMVGEYLTTDNIDVHRWPMFRAGRVSSRVAS